MLSTFLGDIIILLGIPLVIGVALVFLADFLKGRRDEKFLRALNQIINKKQNSNDTDKKSDE